MFVYVTLACSVDTLITWGYIDWGDLTHGASAIAMVTRGYDL